MAIQLTDILTNIDSVTDKINSNTFIENARKAFKDDIALYEINDDEKAKLIATYEAQLSVGVIAQIIQLAKEMPMMIAQEELLRKQIETETNKAEDIAKATELRTEQIKTEKRRQEDILATINIKNQDAIYKFQQAKFEESRRLLGIKANLDNMQIRKAMARVDEMNAFMTNDSYDVTAEQFNASKTTIDEISTAPLTYTSEVTVVPTPVIPATLT